ncbi:MAG: hypothetical protein RQ853_03985, partial [Acidianus sp.]|nr:hypothetical protein [Acidianus sp.]
GRRGLRELAEAIWYRSHYAAQTLSKLTGFVSPALKGEFFEDFVVSAPLEYETLWHKVLERGYMAGIPLSRFVDWAPRNWGLLSFTELHSKRDIDSLINVVQEVSSS